MPRPHPVIRIATELTDRARRSENHTHVTLKHRTLPRNICYCYRKEQHPQPRNSLFAHGIANDMTDRIGSRQTLELILDTGDLAVDTVAHVYGFIAGNALSSPEQEVLPVYFERRNRLSDKSCSTLLNCWIEPKPQW